MSKPLLLPRDTANSPQKNNGYDQKIVAAFILFLRVAVKDEARIRLDEIVI